MSAFEVIQLEDGERGFRKYSSGEPSRVFHAEAHGLRALAATGTVLTAQVIRVDEQQLVTRYIDQRAPASEAWRELGQSLAELHSQEQRAFGFTEDNFCGASPQPNPVTVDGVEFFIDSRLGFQERRARDSGLLEQEDCTAIGRLSSKLPELLPEQSPALIHGDLWNGNVLFDDKGWLIDPAAHWGWPEADLAMSLLFGGFDAAFYRGYQERRSLEAGWRQRAELYNLYHLLNHLNLFGRAYLAGVRSILDRYS